MSNAHDFSFASDSASGGMPSRGAHDHCLTSDSANGPGSVLIKGVPVVIKMIGGVPTVQVSDTDEGHGTDHGGVRDLPANPRLDEKAAMASRATRKHAVTIEWEELSEEAQTISVSDGAGREIKFGMTNDPVDAVLDLMPHIVPPGTKGL